MKKSVYILEDDKDISEILALLLTDKKYTVKTCPTIASFWTQMVRSLPDIVLLDVMLPDGNGIDICTMLKKHQLTHEIPVLMMSAHYNMSMVRDNCTAEAFIAKPFDIQEMLQKVQEFID